MMAAAQPQQRELTAQEREEQFLPIAYLNTETEQMYLGESDPVLDRFTYRRQVEGGTSRFANLQGDGTMIIPTADQQAQDARRRRGRPLWEPIFDQAVVDAYIEEEYGDGHAEPTGYASVVPPAAVPAHMAPIEEVEKVANLPEGEEAEDEGVMAFGSAANYGELGDEEPLTKEEQELSDELDAKIEANRQRAKARKPVKRKSKKKE